MQAEAAIRTAAHSAPTAQGLLLLVVLVLVLIGERGGVPIG